MNPAELWARLSADGFVDGAKPEPEPAGSPWFVRLMLGIAGWIGALFLLGFFAAALTSVVDNAASAMISGTACCAGAYALFRTFAGQDLAEQFALAISLAGQALLVIGLAQFFGPEQAMLCVAVALVEAVLVLVVPVFLHRLLASCGTAVALALAVNQLSLHGLAAPLLCAALAAIWLPPARWAVGARLWRPIGYGLVFALLSVETLRLFGAEALFGRAADIGWMARYGPLIGRGLTGAVLVWAAVTLTLREGLSPASRPFLFAVGGAVLAATFCLPAPGLGSALLILLLGFAAGNRLLKASGVLGLLGFTAHFYYSLHATLLTKSGFLAATGLCLLAASLALRRGAVVQEEARHA